MNAPRIFAAQRHFVAAIIITLLALVASGCGQNGDVDLTTASASEFAKAKSTNMTIEGFRLGMSRQEAEQNLAKSPSIIGEQDEHNPTRLYVFGKNPNGSKGDSLLYLIWEPGQERLSTITVFGDYRARLSADLRPLLTFEVLSDSSEVRKKLLGYPTRTQDEEVAASIAFRHTHYFYEDKGVQVTRTHSSDGDEVVFALIPPKM